MTVNGTFLPNRKMSKINLKSAISDFKYLLGITILIEGAQFQHLNAAGLLSRCWYLSQ